MILRFQMRLAVTEATLVLERRSIRSKVGSPLHRDDDR